MESDRIDALTAFSEQEIPFCVRTTKMFRIASAPPEDEAGAQGVEGVPRMGGNGIECKETEGICGRERLAEIFCSD